MLHYSSHASGPELVDEVIHPIKVLFDAPHVYGQHLLLAPTSLECKDVTFPKVFCKRFSITSTI